MHSNSTILAFVFIIVTICKPIKAQEADSDIEQLIESQAESDEENWDFSDVGEDLEYLKKNPINLNTATKDQLNKLFFLTPQNINALLAHRANSGPFLDLLELQGIEGLSSETVNKIIPYVTVQPGTPFGKSSLADLYKRGEHDLMLRLGYLLEDQRGFKVPNNAKDSLKYLGSPHRLFLRYRYQSENKLRIGVTMEKDAGEAFFKGAQKYGFDFYSGFIAYQDPSIFQKVIIGDYSLQFGQGLTMWSGQGFGKVSTMSTIAKNEIGLRPYSSTNESLFLRGIAATVGMNNFSFTPFVSYRNLDGNLNSEQTAFSSINESGFHRSVTELNHKGTVTQFIYGSSASLNYENLKIGSILYRTNYNKPFEAGESDYKQFNFAASSLTNIGVFYHYNWRNTYFFGELSHSLHSGYGSLNGLIASLTKQISFTTVYRNYEKDYHSFFNTALAESSSAVNEKGLYSGLIISLNPRTEISVYSDVFSFPWLKYRVDAPSRGNEILVQVTFTPNKRLKFFLRYKSENKEENTDFETTYKYLESVHKDNFRGELNYKINSFFQLRNRIEMVAYKKGAKQREAGYLMYQDVIFNPLGSRFAGNIRFAIFDTGGFDSRLYTYERDVLYSYSLPAFQNSGIRFYFNTRFKLKKGVDVWIRYAITKYANIDEVGSGLDMIEGNQKSDLKAQIRLQF